MTAHRTNSIGGSAAIVRKLWHYCNVLRDDGLSYPDYVEQLTYLLFLKMSDEQAEGQVPPTYAWRSFADLDAEAMHEHYSQALATLGEGTGILAIIFRNAKNKIRDPAKLRLLIVDLIGQTEWSYLSTDVKGDAYEGLLEKNAQDTKSGAGQYFTPRPLIDAIVECIDPQLGEVICDPACGTGGFLLAAHQHLRDHNPRLTPSQQHHLATNAFCGVELVEEVVRLAAMNLLLHGVVGNADAELPITCGDSLKEPPRSKVDVVLTNPPFGVKGSVTYSNERKVKRGDDELTIIRPDFWVQTANKQLNFVQHVVTLLKPGGRAAVIIPDNVLFESGAATVVRRQLLKTCHVHTLLRLPAGLFYAQGVKANVLFFNRTEPGSHGSSHFLWVYDLRSNNRFSLRTRPLQRDDLQDFVTGFQSRDQDQLAAGGIADTNRWRIFDTAALLCSDNARIDLSWDTETAPHRAPGLSRLDELSHLIAEDLHRALAHISRASSPD